MDGGNIPASWFDSYVEFLKAVVGHSGGRGCVAQEAGSRRGRIHLQSAIEASVLGLCFSTFFPWADLTSTCYPISQVRTPGTADEGKAALKKVLEENVILRSPGRRMNIKPFSKFQNMLAMVGYCMKDDGKVHYRFHAVNIPEEELDNCRSLVLTLQPEIFAI